MKFFSTHYVTNLPLGLTKMFWSVRTSRDDIGSSDDSDFPDRPARHRNRSKRDSKADRSMSWVPLLFGGSSTRNPILSSKKSRRRDRKKSSSQKPVPSRIWGLVSCFSPDRSGFANIFCLSFRFFLVFSYSFISLVSSVIFNTCIFGQLDLLP